MLNDFKNSIILAIILVMGIIVISLGWRFPLNGVAVPGPSYGYHDYFSHGPDS
jgi:hypothetical protein